VAVGHGGGNRSGRGPSGNGLEQSQDALIAETQNWHALLRRQHWLLDWLHQRCPDDQCLTETLGLQQPHVDLATDVALALSEADEMQVGCVDVADSRSLESGQVRHTLHARVPITSAISPMA
jgi:hypothetical protein